MYRYIKKKNIMQKVNIFVTFQKVKPIYYKD